jgi:hypothetical protein
MTAPYTGRCQCGHLQYEIKTEPVVLYVCHCTDCQKQSSSAFGMSMTVPREAFSIAKGETKSWSSTTETGNKKTGHFCPECGTRIFNESSRRPQSVNVKPGTLDDTSWLRPVGNFWTRSAQPWVPISESMLNYDKQPTDSSALVERWNEQESS